MYSAGATPVVLNSILWNQGADIHESGGEVTVRYSDVRGSWMGVGNIDDDPAFLDTTYSLDTTSPCIAAGIDSTDIGGVWYFAPPSSFYGSIRPDPPGTPPDMGACESPEPSTGGVPEPGGSRPERFALEQNYPNPFNPGTVIRFVVPGSSEVRLSVVDILGREVSVWIHERLDAGVHEVVFDGSRCASGVYLYRLQAGGFIQTHRMLLLR